MDKKVKKQKKGGINLFTLIIIIAVIILAIVLIKKGSSGTKERYSNVSKSEAETVEQYVKENYLDLEFLETIGNISTEQDKIRCAIDIINLTKEEPATEISESEVVAKYKELFGEALLITEHTFVLSNGYTYNSEKKFTLSSEFTPVTKPDTDSYTLVITNCEKSKSDGEYIISIKGVLPKGIDAIVEYAKANPEKADLYKLAEIKAKEEIEESDEIYLKSLITEENLEELTTSAFTAKLTVKDAGSGKYALVNYEYGK